MDIRKAVLERAGSRIIQCTLVDEAQFLTPEQVDQLRMLVTVNVIATMAFGLRTDFQTKLFPGSQRLLEVADKIEELKTMCRCMESKAIFNARFEDGKITFDGEQRAIDGEEEITYEPLCSACYYTEKNNE